ncbi:MAG: malectin domain-containing carbohydrate-binding protein, partial [Saprospiraceae bacterium]|nr:malectin domain-containing carbohydrate-binding protein [Saprospiraceae bacterium]
MRIFDVSRCLLGALAFVIFFAPSLHADIIVTTYHDQNNNGIQDDGEPLITGLTVEGFDEFGNPFPFLDDGNGTFILPALIPFDRLRIHVTGYNDQLLQGVAGPTSVFFASDGDQIAVPISTGPASDPLNSRILVPCYDGGPAEIFTNSPGFVSFPYEAKGVAEQYGGSGPNPQMDATIAQIGSTWGVAYQPVMERAFASTLVKRHTGLGPEGPGGIYIIDYSNGAAQVSSFNLHGITPSVGPAIDLGTVGMGSTFDLQRETVDVEIDETKPYALSTVLDGTRRASYDLDAFEAVGKMSYGDIDLSEDKRTLWMVNLKQRSLMSLDVSSEEIAVTGANLKNYEIDNLPGLPNLNFLFRQCINTGGNNNSGGSEAFTDPNKVAWDKNKFSLGGTGQFLNIPVANTMNQSALTSVAELYQTFRKGDFSYNIPIPTEEKYDVTLHFVEPNSYGEGARLFDIIVEDSMVEAEFDIVAQAGGSRIATTVTFSIQGSGGTLDFDFVSKQGTSIKEAIVSGIEISGESVMKSGIIQPWGLSFKKGKGYLGVVTDASISQSREHLIACVLSFDPNNVEAGFTEEVAFALNYIRERASNAHRKNPPQALRMASWQAWADDWEQTGIPTQGEQLNIQNAVLCGYAQPIVSDIDFTANGDMVIAMMDRWAHQVGHNNYSTRLGDRTLVTAYASGDAIKAMIETNGTYTVEKTNNDDGTLFQNDDGPSFEGEFFYQDHFDHPQAHHGELITGGMAILPGSGEVVVTVHNPMVVENLPAFPLRGIFTQGLHFYNTFEGTRSREYLFVDENILGKANGLGDMIFAESHAGAEVGNYVWCDANGNGIQDPTENGIDGIDLVLHDKENSLQPVDTVTTSNGGQYIFNGLANMHCYEIRIDLNQLVTLGYSGAVSPLEGLSGPLADSDGDDQTVPGFSAAWFCSGAAGEHQHDIDFGFLGLAAEDCTLAACDDLAGMEVPCANFDSAQIAGCVDPSGMNEVRFYPSLNDADSMVNEIMGSMIRTCNDSCIYARVMRPGDPLCFAIT